MIKYLYLVTLNCGRSHPEHDVFYGNVMRLNGKSPDYGGIDNVCVISHHLDADAVLMLCSAGIDDESQVTIEEITKYSLNDPSGYHGLFESLVNSYFLPYGKYPNIN